MPVDRQLLARVGRLRLASAGLASGALQGERASAAVGSGVTFADHRAYAPGDDPRHVDWNVFARLDALLVRLYHEDRDLRVRIVLDASGSMGVDGKLEHAATLAACLALVGLLGRDRVRLVVVGGADRPQVVEGRDPATLPRFLDVLDQGVAGRTCDTREALLRAAGGERVDLAFLLSDLLWEADALDGAARALAATAERAVVLHILGEGELAPDLSEAARLIDAETGEEAVVGGGPEVEATYAAALAAWRDDVTRTCGRRGVRVVPADTRSRPEQLLLDSLRRAGVVRGAAG